MQGCYDLKSAPLRRTLEMANSRIWGQGGEFPRCFPNYCRLLACFRVEKAELQLAEEIWTNTRDRDHSRQVKLKSKPSERPDLFHRVAFKMKLGHPTLWGLSKACEFGEAD